MTAPHPILRREEARERGRLLSDVRYEVHLDLRGSGDTFPSRTRVAFSCAEPGASSFIDLLAPTVQQARLNGRALPPESFTGTRIVLDQLEAENELVVEAECAYQHTGVGLHRFTDPVDEATYLYTQFEPFDAHRVYACFDQPDLKGRFTMAVEAPADWVVSSNGPVTARPEAGAAGRWSFAETLPISTYITAVVAGPYHEVRQQHGDLDLGVYCRRSLADHLEAEQIIEVTLQGFGFFEETFGYPYPFGGSPGSAIRKYDQLWVPEFNAGAMENAACVTFSEHYLFRSKVTDAARMQRASTILHELAHMWFGNLVTMRWWDDLWLNESFATFVGTLALAEATRFDTAWADFANDIKAWAYRQDQLPSTHPIVADMVDTDAVRTNFDGITYAKGASVLKQLVHWVGRPAFVEGLQGYFRRHKFSNAELADFLSALEKPSGRSLDAWSRQWLETTGVNTIRAAATVADGTYEQVVVRQDAPEGHPTLRPHRMAIGLYDDGAEGLVRRERVELDVEGPETEAAALAGKRIPDLLLLNDDDLAYSKVRLDEDSLRALESGLGRIDMPLARAVAWGATWDMTRDAELAARRFAALVAAHGETEADVGVLQSLLRQAQAAIDLYGDPANRPAARAAICQRARAAMDRCEPGGDFQLVWMRCYAAMADRPEDLRFLRAVLDGEVKIEGLAVDTDLRWHLVTVLAAAGLADDALIAAEEQRDPTDMGRRRAATARTIRPDAAAKQAAWDALLGDTSLPLATMRALAGGLFVPGQDDLARLFAERYPEVLPAIWRERSAEEALLLTSACYAGTLVDEVVVASADRALEIPHLPTPARRMVSEQRDGTLRALRARAVDQD